MDDPLVEVLRSGRMLQQAIEAEVLTILALLVELEDGSGGALRGAHLALSRAPA